MIPKILSIAGFDGSCGAGMQADLKTFSAFGCYGLTVLTALPVQNTTGVKTIYNIPLEIIEAQLDAVFDDTSVEAIKIGMLFSSDIIELISSFIEKKAKNIPIVLDPVMMAKSGNPLLLPEATQALKSRLLPLSTIITPNIPEASEITGLSIKNKEDMELNARKIIDQFYVNAVLLKGGHLESEISDDFYLDKSGSQAWFTSERIITNNTHGTGCTLSAAIASCIGLGLELEKACQIAKHYLSQALTNSNKLSVGKGHGPVHHFYHIWPTIEKLNNL